VFATSQVDTCGAVLPNRVTVTLSAKAEPVNRTWAVLRQVPEYGLDVVAGYRICTAVTPVGQLVQAGSPRTAVRLQKRDSRGPVIVADPVVTVHPTIIPTGLAVRLGAMLDFQRPSDTTYVVR
jgi:hypothetical protein